MSQQSRTLVDFSSGFLPIKKLLSDCRLALGGTEQDYTQGSLTRAIWLLAVPMVLEMGMESVFAICDVLFVARLGADAVAVVGLTESLLTLVFAVAIGLSMATTAVVARRMGEKDPAAAARAAQQAIVLGMLISVPLAVTGIMAARFLLAVMGATDEVVAAGTPYAAIMLGSNVVIMLLFLINAIFRGAGDAALAMRVLWLANIVNLILDPCLIFGLGPFPEWGVTGAAVATTIGRGIGVTYQFWALHRPGGRLTLDGSPWRLDRVVIRRLLHLSIGGIGQYLLATSSWIVLVRIIAVFGSTALAGYTIALRILVFALLPSWGISNAAATLVGQNLGAGQPDRAERSVWRTGLYNVVFLGGVAVVFLVFAPSIVGLFTDDGEILRSGVGCLRIFSMGNMCYAYGMVMQQAFNGAGDTITPSMINFFCYWVLQIPLAYLLAISADLGPSGVFGAVVCSETVLAVAGIIMFRRGQWRKTMV